MDSSKNQFSQKEFFNFIKATLREDVKLVDEVSKALKITNSGAYKKINGDSNLKFNELTVLCQYFNVSFDEYAHGTPTSISSSYPFYSDALKFKPESYHEYWSNILEHLDRLSDLEGLDAVYLTNELPFFYYLQFPNLLYFKMYVWNRTSWHIPRTNQFYDKELFDSDRELHKTREDLIATYNAYSSTEIWNPDMLRVTMLQLLYYVRAGVFKDDNDVLLILEDFNKLVVYLNEVAQKGKKLAFGKNNEDAKDLHIYLNELSISAEIIYIKANDFSLVYKKYDTPNYIRTDDVRVCNHMDTLLDEIIDRSALISKRGQRDRELFFANIYAAVDRFEASIKGMLNIDYL